MFRTTTAIARASAHTARSMSSLGMLEEPYALARAISENGSRGCVTFDYEAKRMIASHASLGPLADYLNNDCADCQEHEGMFFEVGERSGALMGAFVWNTVRGQAAGGIRLRPYEDVADYVCDGLRLVRKVNFVCIY